MLRAHIYKDDRQVERIWAQKIEPGRAVEFTNPSPVLTAALAQERPVLFVRVSDVSTLEVG